MMGRAACAITRGVSRGKPVPGGARWKVRTMKLAVIGGTGLIGSQGGQKVIAAGHQAAPPAPSTGGDLITGKGLDQALGGAEVRVNLAELPTFDRAAPDFFGNS